MMCKLGMQAHIQYTLDLGTPVKTKEVAPIGATLVSFKLMYCIFPLV